MVEVRRHPAFHRKAKEWVKGKRCAWCGRPAVTAHHVFPVHAYPEKEMDESLWQAVCDGECHLRLSHAGDYRAWNPHAVEDAEKTTQRRSERRYAR